MKLARILLAFAALLALSCSKEPGGASSVSIVIKTTEASANASNQFITVNGSGEWTLTLNFQGQMDPWANFGSFSDSDSLSVSGSGEGKLVQFNWRSNADTTTRQVEIVASSKGSSNSYIFTQQGSGSASEIKSDKLGDWMELPETGTDKSFYFTHDMTIAGKTIRNFTYAWDTTHLVAPWVAYPLNAFTMGSGSRTDTWGGIDPKFPSKYQPVLYGAYRDYSYARGHQCPSADRLSYDANVMTFYGVNMTPQLHGLNSNAWATLEGMVRSWSRKFDTLYVVTGCIVEGSTKKNYDNEGKAVTIPTGYYKALMGYKKNGTIADTDQNGGYTAIAFYFEHRSYENSTTAVMNQSMTVDALEAKTGVNFFYKLQKESPTISQRVESNVNSWWKQNI